MTQHWKKVREGPFEKLWGIFEVHEFFSLTFPLHEIFFRPEQEYFIRSGSEAVLFMSRTELNKFDFRVILVRHLIQTAHCVSSLS